ncbi:MAG: RNA 2',3'-cyclic phosphodiesterase [Proteobacteria bacterium]|nr:RNA 2',3'-cyclic phosphodiesterase [Pseudomonadota bacterium]MBU1709198.1 RNA 2',3'-cyclic phosphodiesterase [Pseudomonadota bacterium]
MIRLFVAIDLPDFIREQLGILYYGLPGAKWIEKDQLHLTIRFIGEVDGATFKDISNTLTNITTQAFPMHLESIGFFPPRKTPRVLWAGTGNNPSLMHLRNKIETTLVRAGIEPEQRKFSPHITLARLKDTPIQRLGNFLAGNSLFRTEEFQVEEFHLYSSKLTSKGALHSIENTYPLSVVKQ